VQRGDVARAEAARQRLTEYVRSVSPVFAFNLGATYAVSQPPRPSEAKQLLEQFVQSSCDGGRGVKECARCVVARVLLERMAETTP
jgi:hypothetical protein